jgi:hypothetical protein
MSETIQAKLPRSIEIMLETKWFEVESQIRELSLICERRIEDTLDNFVDESVEYITDLGTQIEITYYVVILRETERYVIFSYKDYMKKIKVNSGTQYLFWEYLLFIEKAFEMSKNN